MSFDFRILWRHMQTSNLKIRVLEMIAFLNKGFLSFSSPIYSICVIENSSDHLLTMQSYYMVCSYSKKVKYRLENRAYDKPVAMLLTFRLYFSRDNRPYEFYYLSVVFSEWVIALYLVNIYLEGVKFGGLKNRGFSPREVHHFSPVCKSVSFQGHFKHSTRRMARRSPSSSPFSLYGHHRLKNESHKCTYLMSMELCYYCFQENTLDY